MENIVFAVWLSSRMEFCADDKRACFDTAKNLVTLAVEVRKSGLLAIEDEIAAMYGFMKKSLQMAIDGSSGEQIRETMQNWIMFGNYRGAELLKRLITLDGVIMIQSGTNPTIVNEELSSFFGEELLSEYKKFADSKKILESVSLPFLMEDFWYNIKSKQLYRETGANLLEELFRNFDNMGIQALIRRIDKHDWLLAAKGSSEFVVQRIINNLSNNKAQELIDAIYRAENIKLTDIISAQNKILTIVKEMEEHGEIVLKKDK